MSDRPDRAGWNLVTSRSYGPPDDDGRWERMMQMTSLYANAVGRHGPDSPRAAEVRAMYCNEAGFTELADALDRIKRGLGGSGIDYPAANP